MNGCCSEQTHMDRGWGYNERQEKARRPPGGLALCTACDMLLQDTSREQNNWENRRKADGSCLLALGRLAQPETTTSKLSDLGRANTQGSPRKLSTRACAVRDPLLPPRGSKVRPRPLVPYLTVKTVSVLTSRESFCFFLILRTYWQKTCKGSR